MLLLTKEKIAKLLDELKDAVHRNVYPIERFKFFEGECAGAKRTDFDDHAWHDFALGDLWGGYDKTAWFRATVPIPEQLRDKKLALRFQVGPRDGGNSTAETMLYVNGLPLQGIDVWHEEAWLPPEFAQQGRVLVALNAWSGVLGVPDRRRFKLAQLVWIDETAESFYFLADTLLKALYELDEQDWRYLKMLDALNRSFHLVDFTKPRSEAFYRSLGEAFGYLEGELERWQALEPEKPTVIGIGHAHIDMAWLWRLSHSREKAARTFTTALHLMRQYPEYRFLHSSPQLYKFLEQDYPEIFARVKEKVASGEWEITGGMWVEPDVNLPSGESLIRQLIFGRRYIRETFGVESYVCWLPDVFGYSWALPQILKKSGMRTFMTTKISWSQFNRFPHDTFSWRGIDGSEILTHFVTTPEEASPFYTYNGQLSPREIKGTWDHYQQKGINDELLTAFGWGDGGGGPTKEMLESAQVMRNLPGFPKVELGMVEPYFERLAARLKDLPVWDGELYLEYHRGTYTSQAQIKRDNRKAELLYHQVEWLASLTDMLTEESGYPDLTDGWELLLLNQFHDILPGSSIRQVYEDSAEDFEKIRAIGEGAFEQAQARLLSGLSLEQDSLIVFNALSWARGGLVELPAEVENKTLAGVNVQPLPSQRVFEDAASKLLVHVPEVPPLGYRAYPLIETQPETQAEVSSPLTVQCDRLENNFYRISLNENGQIESLFDKLNQREVIAAGECGNVLQAFEDKPLAFDAWDIDIFYQEKVQEITHLVSAEVEETGPLRGVLKLSWRFYDSTIIQRLTIYSHSPRIDFRTEVDWHEQQVLVKVAFPTTIRSTKATYDIQFGTIERPTHWNNSWDWARFEVVGHKWADLSEGNYGVALLNDCKYGHDIKDHIMRLTLIKSAIRPDALADKGRHAFTYSLLPHAGTWRESQVIPEAYALNLPLRSAHTAANPGGVLPASYAFAEVDADNVILETLKRAEDGDGWVVRVFETKQSRGEVSLTFTQPLKRVLECNLVEEEERPVNFEGERVRFTMTPYEIKTFKLWF